MDVNRESAVAKVTGVRVKPARPRRGSDVVAFATTPGTDRLAAASAKSASSTVRFRPLLTRNRDDNQ